MIKVSGSRVKDGEVFTNPFRFDSVAKALESLIVYEIGYGGQITEVSEGSLSISTRIMGCVDTTTFEGLTSDMMLFLEAAIWATEFRSRNTEPDSVAYDRVMAITGGRPLHIKLGADMIVGDSTARMTIMAMIAGQSSHTETYAKALSKFDTKTLMAILQLVRVDGVSIDDALDLAAPMTPTLEVTRSVTTIKAPR